MDFDAGHHRFHGRHETVFHFALSGEADKDGFACKELGATGVLDHLA